jgi:hypothetical protein
MAKGLERFDSEMPVTRGSLNGIARFESKAHFGAEATDRPAS